MKVAIIGSRDLAVEDFSPYLPIEVTEIVSGGARGIDQCARRYAKERGLKLTEFLPDYARYGRAAPIKRNELIAEYADGGIAFWDGRSKGTEYTVKYAQRVNKPCDIVEIK